MASDSIRNPSLCLARLIDQIIGTEDQVRVSQRFTSLKDYATNINKKYSIICAGSRGEGYNLQSSDYDFMYVQHDVVVFESTTIDIDRPTDKTVLLMRRDGCRTGYVILQVLSGTHNTEHVDCSTCVTWNDCVVLSSLLLRDLITYENPNCGPHTSYNRTVIDGMDVQAAHCFECKHFPTEANTFFKRQRQYNWPSQEVLDRIRRRGCHLVPVGDKTSDLVSIQWRISFAVAERMLVHSFNHTQLRVYVLMKIFHKQLIETYDGVKDLLCSYFMKTTMFHMIENTSPLIWREDNLITLFWRCFVKLIQWVEDGYCPNYFIPENNLFKTKIYGQNQDNLVQVLHQIKQHGWKSIYRCNDLKDLKQESFNQRLLCLSNDTKYKEANSDFTIFTELSSLNRFNAGFPFPVEQALHKATKLLKTKTMFSERQVDVVVSKILLGMIGQYLFQEILIGNYGNVYKYKTIKTCERLLREGAKVDITRGPLNLALFYYGINRYDKVIEICNNITSSITPYTLFLGPNAEPINIKRYEQCICGRGMGVAEKTKRAVACEVVVIQECNLFYPKELQHDITAFNGIDIHYPPLPFTIFLKFLSYHEQGDTVRSLSTIQDLKILVQDKSQGISNFPLVLNLLAICLDKVGDTTGAVEACLLSLQLKPEHNGANSMLHEMLARA